MASAARTSFGELAFAGDLAAGYHLTLVLVLSLVSLILTGKIGI
jgi:hypothetical protein